MRRAIAAWVALAALLAAPAASRELWRRGDASLDWTGSLRMIGTVSYGTRAENFQDAVVQNPLRCIPSALFPSCPAFDVIGEDFNWQTLTRLRNRLDLTVTPQLSGSLVYDIEGLLGTLDTFERGLFAPQDSFFGAEGNIEFLGLDEHRDLVQLRHRLYRGFIHYESEHFETTVGRQRIPWGVGRLWNPIDRFNAIGPLALEQDVTPGVDAVDARWVLSGFSYVQGVYAPGTASRNARYALRAHGVVGDVDYSLVGGVFLEALTLGFDLAGNFLGSALRTEVVYTDPGRDVWPIGADTPSELPPYWQIVVSADYNFSVGNGLYVLVEHLYNGNALGFGAGRAGPLLPFFESTPIPPEGVTGLLASLGPFATPTSVNTFGGSQVITRSPHITGLQAGYDLSTAWRGNMTLLYDWIGESAAFIPSLSYTGFASMELSIAAQVFAGDKFSEFGDTEPVLYFIAEWFF